MFFIKTTLSTILVIIVLTSYANQAVEPVSTDVIPQKDIGSLPVSVDTAKLIMKEDEFWKLIDRSRTAANNKYETQKSALKKVLLTLSPNQIEAFNNTFFVLLAASYDYGLWGAAYVINGGCSDDCFDYFREYLIGHGKEKFYQTLKDPESCVAWVKSEEQESWEGLKYAVSEAYKEKTGKVIPPLEKIKYELKGKPFDEETVFKQYPKLARKFMGGY